MTGLQKELEDALAGLPTTAAGIADYFVDLGVRGVVNYECACPMARWIRQLLDVPLAKVDLDYIRVYDTTGDVFRTPTPDHVTSFIERFDDEEYPGLVDTTGPSDEEEWEETRAVHEALTALDLTEVAA